MPCWPWRRQGFSFCWPCASVRAQGGSMKKLLWAAVLSLLSIPVSAETRPHENLLIREVDRSRPSSAPSTGPLPIHVVLVVPRDYPAYMDFAAARDEVQRWVGLTQ